MMLALVFKSRKSSPGLNAPLLTELPGRPERDWMFQKGNKTLLRTDYYNAKYCLIG